MSISVSNLVQQTFSEYLCYFLFQNSVSGNSWEHFFPIAQIDLIKRCLLKSCYVRYYDMRSTAATLNLAREEDTICLV